MLFQVLGAVREHRICASAPRLVVAPPPCVVLPCSGIALRCPLLEPRAARVLLRSISLLLVLQCIALRIPAPGPCAQLSCVQQCFVFRIALLGSHASALLFLRDLLSGKALRSVERRWVRRLLLQLSRYESWRPAWVGPELCLKQIVGLWARVCSSLGTEVRAASGWLVRTRVRRSLERLAKRLARLQGRRHGVRVRNLLAEPLCAQSSQTRTEECGALRRWAGFGHCCEIV